MLDMREAAFFRLREWSNLNFEPTKLSTALKQSLDITQWVIMGGLIPFLIAIL